MPQLVVRDVEKSFGSFTAVHGVSFELAAGEVVALLGASGCGKTTLLRAIAGLIEPDSGEVVLADQTLYSRPARISVPVEKRGIGFVFQSYAIWPHMRVWENVAYGLRVRKASRRAARSKAHEMLDVVGLAGFENRYPGTLSGGQQQRVALARCLVVEPPLLLLDEPLSNLDLRVRERMREYIRKLIKQIGVSAVFVTHDYAEALVLADRILVMDSGAIVEDGTPETIYSSPRTSIAAQSIGSSNLLGVAGIDSAGNASINGSEIALKLSGDRRPRPTYEADEPGERTIVVRPEDIVLSPGGGNGHSAATNTIPGKITGRFYLGAVTHYDIQTDLGVLRCQSDDRGIAVDQGVDVHIAPEKLVLLER